MVRTKLQVGLSGGDGKGGYLSMVCLENRSQVSLEYWGLSPQRILSSTVPCKMPKHCGFPGWSISMHCPGIITTHAPFSPHSALVSTINPMVTQPYRLSTESTCPEIIFLRCFPRHVKHRVVVEVAGPQRKGSDCRYKANACYYYYDHHTDAHRLNVKGSHPLFI